MSADRARLSCLRARKKGFALIIVLLVIALLEALVADLATYAWLAFKHARNFSLEAQHMAAVDGILRVAGGVLFQPDLAPERRDAILRDGLQGVALGEAAVDVRIEDESAKLNLNLLADPDPAVAAAAQKGFMALCGVLGEDAALAGRIARFIAGDPSVNDAPPPRRLIILEEMRAVDGVTEALLFGSAAPPDPGANPLAGYVTCSGSGRLNANTASKEVLQAALGDIDADLPGLIVQGRDVHPFASVDEIIALTELPEPAQERLRACLITASEAYQLTVVTRAGEAVQVSRAILQGDPDGRAIVRICRRSS